MLCSVNALLKYGDPGLKRRAEPVEAIDDEVRAVVRDILQVMEEEGAIGLSACHIGVFLRIIVIGQKAYINPKLSDPSEETEMGEEGSISLPGVRVQIERPRAVTIEAQDLEGKVFSEQLEGLDARIAMHENDQLNGIFFLSRLPKKLRKQVLGQIGRS